MQLLFIQQFEFHSYQENLKKENANFLLSFTKKHRELRAEKESFAQLTFCRYHADCQSVRHSVRHCTGCTLSLRSPFLDQPAGWLSLSRGLPMCKEISVASRKKSSFWYNNEIRVPFIGVKTQTITKKHRFYGMRINTVCEKQNNNNNKRRVNR